MQSHLRDHTMNERLEEAAVIQQMGYDTETVKVICPLCKLLLCNHKEFTAHLQSVHLTTDSTHLAQFRESVASSIRMSKSEDIIWYSWIVKGSRMETVKSMVCPACGQPASTRCPVDRIDHHLQLLDQNEFRPYRWDILRLCPDFGSHPVFDDVKAVVFKAVFPSN